MDKYIKLSTKIKVQEKDINIIIPEIAFLSKILRREGFIESMKKELLSLDEITSFTKIMFNLIFLFITLPIWFLGETFNIRCNQKYFSKIYSNKFIFTKNIIEKQKAIFDKYSKEIIEYKKIIGEDNFFNHIEKYNYLITQEDFDTITIRSETVIYMEYKLNKLYKSFENNPDYFTDYFNFYVSTKKNMNEDLNFIAKSLNTYIIKNKSYKKSEEKLHKATIIQFNKKD
jgi:hypothetical protein